MAEIPNTLLENIERITRHFEKELELKKNIHDLLKNISEKVSKHFSGLNTFENNTKKMKDIVEEISDEIVIESYTVAKAREIFEKSSLTFSRTTNELTTKTARLNTVFSKTISHAEKGDTFFSSLFENFSELGGKAGILFSTLGFAVKQLEYNIDIYRRLVMSGVQVEGGLLEMRQMFKDIGLYTTDAIDVLIQNASLVNRLTRKNLVEFEESIDENIMNLVGLGLPYNEIKKWSINYLATQRNLGKLRELTMAEQANLFNETLEEFYRSSQWLGTSVRDFVQEYKRMTENPRTRTALQTLPVHAQNLIVFLSKVLPEELVQTITDAVLLGAVERTNNYVDLTVAGLTPFVRNVMELIMKPGTTVDELVETIKQLPVENEEIQRLFVAGMDRSANILAQVGLAKRKLADQLQETLTDEERNASVTRIWMKNVTEMRIKLFDLQSELLARANEILKKYPQLGEAIIKALDIVNNFVSSKIFNLIEYTFKTFASIFDTIRNVFNFIFSPLGIPDFVSSLATGGLLYGVGKSLKNVLKGSLVSSFIIPAIRTSLKGIFDLAGIVLKSRYGRLAAAAGLLGYAAKSVFESLSEKTTDIKKEEPGIEEFPEVPTSIPTIQTNPATHMTPVVPSPNLSLPALSPKIDMEMEPAVGTENEFPERTIEEIGRNSVRELDKTITDTMNSVENMMTRWNVIVNELVRDIEEIKRGYENVSNR